VDFKARVDGLREISWWVLGYGDQVKVLAPPELAIRVGEVARKVARQYPATGKSPGTKQNQANN
jgi:proteasome accessory factor B